MRNFFKAETLATGLAMFSMFFGAGNVIYPLAVGLYAGDKSMLGIAGLIVTAVLVPLAGVIAMILFNGDYKAFFGRIGRVPGFLLALTIITLLGPLGSSPRCIALSYATMKLSFPSISPIWFSLVSCIIIFLCAYKKNRIIPLLGYVLTPMLLFSLAVIIVKGLLTAPNIVPVEESNLSIFVHGLKEGYNMMDLLAAFFFSSAILVSLRKEALQSHRDPVELAFRASFVAAALLAIVYIGFGLVASFHGNFLEINGTEDLLGAIALKIIGPSAGLIVSVAVTLACLTTAIALLSIFAEFLQHAVFDGKISYVNCLIVSLIVTFFVSTWEFTGISAFLVPILKVCYPGLIVLTILNIAYRLKNFQPIKVPVFLTFAIAFLVYII